MSDSHAATIQVTYEPDIDAMLVTIQGRAALDDYRKALSALIHAEGFHSKMNTIWDLRKADMRELSVENILDIVTLSVNSAGQRGPAWTAAVVVEGYHGFRVGRMLEMLTDDAPYRMAVFRTVQEAEQWMKQEVA